MNQIKKGAKLHLDLISQFTRDISMRFGNDKCVNLNNNSAKQKFLGHFLNHNETKPAELT